MCVNVWPGSRPTEPPPRERPDLLSLEPEHRARYEIVRRAKLEGWSEARLDAVLPPLPVTPRGEMKLTQARCLAACNAIVGRGEPLTHDALVAETGASRVRTYNVVQVIRNKGLLPAPIVDPRHRAEPGAPWRLKYDRSVIRELLASHPAATIRELREFYRERTGETVAENSLRQVARTEGDRRRAVRLAAGRRSVAYRDDVVRALIAERPGLTRQQYHALYVARTGHECEYTRWRTAMKAARVGGPFRCYCGGSKPRDHDRDVIRLILDAHPDGSNEECREAYIRAARRRITAAAWRALVSRVRRASMSRGA